MKTEPKKRVKKRWVLLLALVVAVSLTFYKIQQDKPAPITIKKIQPIMGDIRISISTSGIIQPEKRIEITPPVSGRVEQMLVDEGSRVTKGQIVAWLSSTERAALLDAALAQGASSIAYWQNVYKPTPLVAPASGEVIVRAIDPGQTFSSSTPLLILADRLIVNAQVDETDIGKIQVGQKAIISLDAYPEINVEAKVAQIAYEAKTVSNVTMYDVIIIPNKVPRVFRSGMSASIEIIENERKNVLTIPLEAIKSRGERSFVNLYTGSKQEPRRKQIVLGLKNDTSAEVLSGLTAEDTLVISEKRTAHRYKPRTNGTSPFMSSRPGGGGLNRGGGQRRD